MQVVAAVGFGSNNLKTTASMMRKKSSTEWRLILAFVSIGLLQVLILKSYSFVLPTPQKSYIQMNSRSLLFSRIYHNNNQQQQQQQKQEVSQELSLLSFDLDDTLFSIGDVVRDANNAMIEAMIDRGCHDITMDEFLENTISIRKARNGRSITYRDLRKSAIRQTFERSMAFQNQNKHHRIDNIHMDSIVEDCYTSWVRERHISAERYLFPDAIDTLRTLKEMFPNTCFAAITNGAGDPLEMTNTLAPYFDFRISGEDEDIFPHRKPHPFIYQKALNEHEKIMLRLSSDDESRLNNNNEGVWCHVGDCVANDVGASADCGAKAIWMCLDESDDDVADAVSRLTDTNKNIPNWSTATKDEIEKRAELVQQDRSKMAASIRSLSELPDAIRKILESCDNSNPI
jgi:FMN phosphatase YigB (HAD superfamily)